MLEKFFRRKKSAGGKKEVPAGWADSVAGVGGGTAPDVSQAQPSTKKTTGAKPDAASTPKTHKPRKPRTCFGRVEYAGFWFEQRASGVYVRRRYGRKWNRVSFDIIRDEALGQFRFPPSGFTQTTATTTN